MLRFIRAVRVPLLFAVVTVVAYGLLLPLTGFYWDDWPFAWLAHFRGPADFIPAFRGFRPFLGPIFFITTSLLPTSPLPWQIFALVIRFLSGLAAWFALIQVWPWHKQAVLVASLLFLTYPGYSQHWVALTHINQEWIPLIFYLLSFAFSLRALRLGPSRSTSGEQHDTHSPDHSVGRVDLRLSAIAIVLLIAGLFPTEYFIGLEPLRFLFIWVVVAEATQGFRPRLREALRHWWPYLLIWLADAAWLAYYYKSGMYVSYDATAVQSVPALSQAALVFADALWKAGLYVWAQVLVLASQTLTAPVSLLTFALILICFGIGLLRFRDADESSRSFGIAALVIGLIGILLGRVPSFVADLPLTLQSSYDRFMISMMLGASLFVVGLVELLFRRARLKVVVFAALIALGIGQQVFNANIFRRDWVRQQEIYWEMAWRMPALKRGTALITQQMPLDYETDFSMTAAMNWIYAPELHPASLPYALVYSEKRLGGVVLPNLQPGTPMHFPFRTVDFNGSTSQVISIYVAPDGCLRVLDPALDDAETYSRFPDSLTAPIAISDPSRIMVDAPSPALPAALFGKEPVHTWCYYYEKAELARQKKDWHQIVKLAADAKQGGFAPQDAFEWLPFIEAYARTDDVQQAGHISQDAWDQDPKLHRGLCVVWQRILRDGTDAQQKTAAVMTGQFHCGQ